MKSKNLKVCSILIMLTFILASCMNTGVNNTAEPIIKETSDGSDPSSETYPISETANQENNTQPQSIPTPSSGSSVISGHLFSVGEDLPARLVRIYFATKTLLTPGPGYMLSYEEVGSPNIQTDETGLFVITDILPGEYFLIMVTPVNSYSVIDDDGNQVIVVAEEGKTYDLGKLYVDWP